MPNKKKQQRNSFYFFMKEKQAEFAKQGKKINMSDMANHVHSIWMTMSLAEKERYEQMAKASKIEYNAVGRLACDGTLIKENMEAEERKEELEKQMRQGITDLLRVPGGSKEEFIEANSRKKFYFLTFNILCCAERICIPIEVGAVEYSIKDGISARFHKFIRPGPIPKGYTGEAKRHSEDTHQIPISGHEDSVKDYRKIWKELMGFICPTVSRHGNTPPPLFCLKEDMFQTLGGLEWLARRADVPEDYLEDLKVWDASYLLMELRAGAECAAASYVIAAENLKKNNFDYIPNTRCYFHEDLDSPHCSLGYANRLCYLLSDSVCGLFGVQVTERHLPLRAMANKPYEVHIPTFQNVSLSSTNERGMGRGLPKVWNKQSSRPASDVRDGMHSSLSERTNSRLSDRTDSRLHDRTDSRLHDRTELNNFMGISSKYSYEKEASVTLSDSDSENSLPGTHTENTQRIQTPPSVASSTVQLRQPISTSIALSLARAAQAPAVVPGKGIGRGQKKLP